jgi:DNA-directed RNA polymerase I, II, and III subunit RPABC2
MNVNEKIPSILNNEDDPEKEDVSDDSSTDMSNAEEEDEIQSVEDDFDDENEDEDIEETENNLEDDIADIVEGDDIIDMEQDNTLEELEMSDDEYEAKYEKLENYVSSIDLEKMHPEIKSANFDEINASSRVVRDETGKIIDPLHTTPPFITKYEKARIIGTRTEQLESGANPYIELDNNIVNGRTIAMMEFEQKKIPFIIARPLPNKAVEYWRLADLEYV